jgi:hypothetical protein
MTDAQRNLENENPVHEAGRKGLPEAKATPGTVTVLLTIPWTCRADGPEGIDAAKEKAFRLFGRTMSEYSNAGGALERHGFNLSDIDVADDATFEADPEPGDDG